MVTRLQPGDYDQYEIKIPMKYLIGKKKEIFLIKELEKRHPCFSESFVFDAKFKIKKAGIISCVTVMKKNLLNKIRIKNKGFIINDQGKIVFADKNKWLAISLPVILILFIVIFFAGKNKKTLVQSKVNEFNSNEEETDFKVPDNENFISVFLSEISRTNGKLEKFCWKTDSYSEFVTGNLINCVPYEIESLVKNADAEISEINYTGNEPGFSFRKNFKTSFLHVSENYLLQSEISEKVNRILKSEKIENFKESFKPLRFEFQGNINLLKKIEKEFRESGWALTELQICKNQDEKYSFVISFSDQIITETGVKILSWISETEKIFQIPGTEKDHVGMFPEETAIKVLNDKKRIGEIKHSGGKTTVFYKNQKGNIENEKS